MWRWNAASSWSDSSSPLLEVVVGSDCIDSRTSSSMVVPRSIIIVSAKRFWIKGISLVLSKVVFTFWLNLSPESYHSLSSTRCSRSQWS